MNHREFRELFREFRGDSWAAWASIEDSIFGVAPADAALVRKVTGRAQLPTGPVSEFLAVVGRGGGKSRFAARLACFFAAGRTYAVVPGERIFVSVVAPDRKQAGITFNYIRGLLRSVPALSALIESERADSIDLSNGTTVEVIAATVASPRGRAYALVIVEEMAFLPVESDADPDTELLRAVRPALARVPGSLLAMISSPYAMRGEVFNIWAAKFGVDDPDILVVQADTATLNPSFSAREIKRAYATDPIAAGSEYGGNFRHDVSTLLLHEAIAAVVPIGVRELPPDATRRAVAHIDPATGSGEDDFALAIAFVGAPAELAVLRRWAPPFDPSAVAREAAVLLKRYGIHEITRDRFAGGLVDDLFRRVGITCVQAEMDTSGAFVAMLGLVNSRGCRLVDDEVLIGQLRGLERRAMSGGKDRVGHRARQHDDVAAAASFALVTAAHAHDEMPFMLIGGDRWFEYLASLEPDDEPTAEPPAEPEASTPGVIETIKQTATAVKDRVVAAVTRTKAAVEQLALPKLSGPDDCWVAENGMSPYGSQHMTPADAAASGLIPRSSWTAPARMRRRKKPKNELEAVVQTGTGWFPGDACGATREPPSRFGLLPRRGPRFPDRW